MNLNTSTITTVTLACLLATFSACEGEPPKAPTNPPPTPVADAVEPTAAPAPAQRDSGAAPEGAASDAPHCPPCTTGGAHPATDAPCPAGAVGSTGSALPATAAAPAVVAGAAPAATATHAIVGTVATLPARAAGTAVVYLEDAGIVPGKGSSAGVDNHGMSFGPYVTVVTVGGRVVFSNSDPFPHNVFSPDNEKFNLGTVQMKGSTAHTFKTAGVYSLLCNLHPNMLGYVLVSPSSYFAKANSKGEFTIKDVPPGTYKITAWAPRLALMTQPVTVKDADVTADFALHR